MQAAGGPDGGEEAPLHAAVRESGLEGLIAELLEEAGHLCGVEEEVVACAEAALSRADALQAEAGELRKAAEDAALDKCAPLAAPEQAQWSAARTLTRQLLHGSLLPCMHAHVSMRRPHAVSADDAERMGCWHLNTICGRVHDGALRGWRLAAEYVVFWAGAASCLACMRMSGCAVCRPGVSMMTLREGAW
jgi:hypothetical protein